MGTSRSIAHPTFRWRPRPRFGRRRRSHKGDKVLSFGEFFFVEGLTVGGFAGGALGGGHDDYLFSSVTAVDLIEI